MFKSARAFGGSLRGIACFSAAALPPTHRNWQAQCGDSNSSSLACAATVPVLGISVCAGVWWLYKRQRDLRLLQDFCEDDLKMVFRFIDKDGNGYVAAAELYHIMNEYGMRTSRTTAEDMIREADNKQDPDGRVEFDELEHLLRPLWGATPGDRAAYEEVSQEWRALLLHILRQIAAGCVDPWETYFPDSLKMRSGVRWRYDPKTEGWKTDNIKVKIFDEEALAEGAMRICYRMKKMYSRISDADIAEQKPSALWKHQKNYVAKKYKDRAPSLKKYMLITALDDVMSNTKDPILLKRGETFLVIQIDEDGDAQLALKDHAPVWIFENNFCHFRVEGNAFWATIAAKDIRKAKKGDSLISAEFTLGDCPGTFRLEFYPKGTEAATEGYCSLYLRSDSGGSMQVHLTVNQVTKRVDSNGPATWKKGGCLGFKNFCKTPDVDVHLSILLPGSAQQLQLSSEEQMDLFRRDLMMQMKAKELADAYNKLSPPKVIDFLDAYIVKLDDGTIYWVEAFVPGRYAKHNSNASFVGNFDVSTMKPSPIRSTPQAFSHFTFEYSRGSAMVVDMQGVGDLYTDPQLHTIPHSQDYGSGNFGAAGMTRFFQSHECNDVCRQLGLTPFDKHPSVSEVLQKDRIGNVGNSSVPNANDKLLFAQGTKATQSSEAVADVIRGFGNAEELSRKLHARSPHLLSEAAPWPKPSVIDAMMAMMHFASSVLLTGGKHGGVQLTDEMRGASVLYHLHRAVELGIPPDIWVDLLQEKGFISKDQASIAKARYVREVKAEVERLIPCSFERLVHEAKSL